MNKTLTVKEYDTIVCDRSLASSPGYVYLEEKYFSELEHFIKEYTAEADEADILDFMRLGYRRGSGDTVTFKSYVGIIELPSGYQIEILPKIALDQDDNNAQTKRIFIKMLSCLREFEGKVFNSASLNSDRMNLYEIFIRMFIEMVSVLVKRGIRSDYILNEDNLCVFKGKLDVNKHLIKNIAHKERFYMVYDEYQVNRPENKLIKATLLKLLRVTNETDNSRRIRQLLYSFELVDESVNYEKDFSKVNLSRGMKEYDLILQWAKIFLFNKSFTTFSGKTAGKAILFPMERVFEAFMAKQIKMEFENHKDAKIIVKSQDNGYYLFDEPERVRFSLRPDIVVENHTDDNHKIVIMDTKWKRLNNLSNSNYGISQPDMYQMFAYSKRYNTSDICLIYPLNEDVDGLDNLCFRTLHDEGRQVNVRVIFVDLSDYQNEVRRLYETVYGSYIPSWN